MSLDAPQTSTKEMATVLRKKKALVITDKDGNVIDLGGKQSAIREVNNNHEFRDTAEQSQTVTFDVGGQIFKVAARSCRSTLTR